MSQKQKDERAKRRARCVQAGEDRLLLIRSGEASQADIDEMRGAVLRGDCPLCGESGFKSIAGHCQIMHRILSRELRDMIGITFTETICSGELHEKLSVIHAGKNPQATKKPTGQRTYSKAGEIIRQKNLAPVLTWVTKDVLRKNGRQVGLTRKGKIPWNKSTQHGMRGMYRQGCRCELCVFASKEYNRNLNIRRRSKPSNGEGQRSDD